MTIDEAKQKLLAYRQEQNQLRKKIDELRDFLRKHDTDPDAPVVDLTGRNKVIYGRHLDGLTFVEIGKEFKLSPGRIKSICKRVEIQNEQHTTAND